MIAWVTWITWLPARLNPRCGARLLLQRGAARRDVASWRHTQCSPLIGWMGLDPCPSRHSRISRIHGQTTSVVSRGLEVGLVRTGQLCRLDPSFRMPSFILPVLPPPSPAFHYSFPSPQLCPYGICTRTEERYLPRHPVRRGPIIHHPSSIGMWERMRASARRIE